MLIVILQPIASIAVPAPSSGLVTSGDPARPTLSWEAASDEPTSGDEWIKRDGRPAGGAVAPWAARTGQATLVYNGKMWVLGGSNSSGALNDVWSSSDGVNWTEATASADWAGRANLSATVFNGKMWIMGGDTSAGGVLLRAEPGSGVANDVWSSSDGVNWTQVTDTAAWSVRKSSALQVFNGKMWLLGGSLDGGTHLTDVWQSDDGATWSQVTANAPWGALLGPASIIYDSKMWIMGGGLSDVWYTTDGTNWIRTATGVEWGGRVDNSLALIDGKMWITGGSYSRDAWTSSDGATWTKVVTNAEWVVTSTNTAVTFNNQLWLLGSAYSGFSPVFKQVWRSSDGITWSTPENIVPGGNQLNSRLTGTSAVSYKNSLWVVGNDPAAVEVWKSQDGTSWSKVTDTSSIPSRYDYNLVVFQDKLWIIGGCDSDYNYTNEVWSSSDGAHWTREAASVAWPGRGYQTVLVYNNLLWIIGGETDTTDSYLIGDVWYSADGINWTQATSSAPWGPRGYHASVVFDGKMWVFGGSQGDSWVDMNDAWSSTDGINWTQETTAAEWAPINGTDGFKIFVLNNELWMIHDNGIWKSSNGLNWTEIAQTMVWGGRSGYAAAVFDSRLWAIGGQADGFLTNEVWSTPNRAISHYEVCWDRVQGGCSNKDQVSVQQSLAAVKTDSSWLARLSQAVAPATSAAGAQIAYAFDQPLSPGTWYLSVLAVNFENEGAVLGDSVIRVEPMTSAASTDISERLLAVVNDSAETAAPSDSDISLDDDSEQKTNRSTEDVELEESGGNVWLIAAVLLGLVALTTVALVAYRRRRRQ